MAHARKTLTQYADELEQWVAQGWLTGQETFIELQDMATLTDLIYQEAAGSREVQAEILGIKGRFEAVLASRLPPGSPWDHSGCPHTHPRQPILACGPAWRCIGSGARQPPSTAPAARAPRQATRTTCAIAPGHKPRSYPLSLRHWWKTGAWVDTSRPLGYV